MVGTMKLRRSVVLIILVALLIALSDVQLSRGDHHVSLQHPLVWLFDGPVSK